MSSIAWLDTSPEDERRMREIVKMFSDTSTLDDLGIGQVRDSLADLMFPGTSTIHARPRYFLIIPWIFQRAASKHTGTMITSKANDEERKLIEVMRSPTPVRGMIGSRAGKSVQNLPSSIYWAALQRYKILVNARALRWDIPVAPPHGFPKTLEDGLDLSREEAQWLRERIRLAAPESYLAYLLADGLSTDPDAAMSPWGHPSLEAAPRHIRAIVQHARLFALAINGATLIYNLLIAEKFDAVSANTDSLAAYYTHELASWGDEVDRHRSELARWDLDTFWTTVSSSRAIGNPVAPGTSFFVNEWIGELRRSDARTMSADARIRRMIAERERRNKGEQSRLNNERQIKNWGGASGSARLSYRWATVQTLLTDIKEGLDRASA